MSQNGASFGLNFVALGEESQLHGTMNGTGRPLSTSGTSSTSASSAAVASSAMETTSSATTASTNSPAGSSPSAKATSYDSHSRLIAGYPRLPGFYGSTYSGEQSTLYPANSASFYPSLVKISHSIIRPAHYRVQLQAETQVTNRPLCHCLFFFRALITNWTRVPEIAGLRWHRRRPTPHMMRITPSTVPTATAMVQLTVQHVAKTRPAKPPTLSRLGCTNTVKIRIQQKEKKSCWPS